MSQQHGRRVKLKPCERLAECGQHRVHELLSTHEQMSPGCAARKDRGQFFPHEHYREESRQHGHHEQFVPRERHAECEQHRVHELLSTREQLHSG